MIKKLRQVFKTRGIKGVFDVGVKFVLPAKIAAYKSFGERARGCIGLEIGGPSQMFRRGGVFPVYTVAKRVDNCNFGHKTIWEGTIAEGATFHYDNRHMPGNQFVAEATDLGVISSGVYDFILSSHVLEHVANPLKALKEWRRVLKDEGVLTLIVPHRDGTFDHRRPVTQMDHLIEDFDRHVGEDDLTHLDEILALHDLAMDREAGDFNAFRERSLKNVENRGLHHHVFDTRLTVDVLNYMGLQILAVEVFRPYNILIVAQKPKNEMNIDNCPFRGGVLDPCRRSPFATDRATG